MTEEVKTNLPRDELKYMLSLPQGRKVIWGMLSLAGLFRQPFVTGDRDITALNCGSLNIGLILYADCMTVSPELTAMMTREQGNYDNVRSSNPDNGNLSDTGNADDGYNYRDEYPKLDSRY